MQVSCRGCLTFAGDVSSLSTRVQGLSVLSLPVILVYYRNATCIVVNSMRRLIPHLGIGGYIRVIFQGYTGRQVSMDGLAAFTLST